MRLTQHTMRQSLLPIAIFFALGTTLLSAWWINLANRIEATRIKTEITTRQISTRLEDFFATRMRVLDMFRMEWLTSGPMEHERFVHRSLQIQDQFPGLQAVNWIDADGIIRWVVPLLENQAALNHNLHQNPHAGVREAIVKASLSREIAVTPPIKLVQGGMGVTCYFPLVRGTNTEGFINGVFGINTIVTACLTADVIHHYQIEIHFGQLNVYSQGRPSNAQVETTGATSPFKVGEETWELTLVPRPGAKAGAPTPLDFAVLSLALLLALALALLVRASFAQQDKLIASEMKYRLLFRHANDGVLVIDNGQLVDCNDKALDLFGKAREDMIGLPPFLFSPDQQPTGESSFESAGNHLSQVEHGDAKVFEWLYSRPDGSNFYAELSLNTFEHHDSIYTLALIRDVTQKKDSEKALRESEEKYRLLIENAHDAIFIVQDGVIKFPNPMTQKMTGYAQHELESLDILDLVHSDDRKFVATKYYKQIHGKKAHGTYSFRIHHLNQDILWVELSTVRVVWDNQPATLNFVRDITQQKDLEVRLLEAQKLEAVGTLAGGVAHDFNNLLMGIQGNATLLIRELGSGHPVIERIQDIESLVQSGSNLTRQLLGFARGGSYEVVSMSVNDLVERTADVFGRTRKEISIHADYAAELWSVEGDQSQLERVLLNIFVNAWQAMPSGGQIYISTKNCQLDLSFCQPFEMVPGRYVKISIRDTGIGMDPTTRNRVFEPFFTNKYQRRGTGLGLASAYGIVRAHNGIINVESTLGQGAVFHIYLPATTKPAAMSHHVEEQIQRGHGRILVVDDELEVLQVTANMLLMLGYEVVAIQGGHQAIEYFEQDHEAIEMVMIDMIMPDMNGFELFDQLVKIKPGIRIILSSGYSMHEQARKLMDRGCLGFIQKPYRLETLSTKVRQAFEAEINAV